MWVGEVLILQQVSFERAEITLLSLAGTLPQKRGSLLEEGDLHFLDTEDAGQNAREQVDEELVELVERNAGRLRDGGQFLVKLPFRGDSATLSDASDQNLVCNFLLSLDLHYPSPLQRTTDHH